jgi:hypothetical protein
VDADPLGEDAAVSVAQVGPPSPAAPSNTCLLSVIFVTQFRPSLGVPLAPPVPCGLETGGGKVEGIRPPSPRQTSIPIHGGPTDGCLQMHLTSNALVAF